MAFDFSEIERVEHLNLTEEELEIIRTRLISGITQEQVDAIRSKMKEIVEKESFVQGMLDNALFILKLSLWLAGKVGDPV